MLGEKEQSERNKAVKMFYLENVGPPWLILKQVWKKRSLKKLLHSSWDLFHFVERVCAFPGRYEPQTSPTSASLISYRPRRKMAEKSPGLPAWSLVLFLLLLFSFLLLLFYLFLLILNQLSNTVCPSHRGLTFSHRQIPFIFILCHFPYSHISLK